MSEPNKDVGAFLNRLDEELSLYRAMMELSRSDLAARTGGEEPTGMLERLAEKQRIMGRIDRIEKEIRPLKEGWETFREHVQSSQRDEAEDRMRCLRETIKRLIELETEWNDTLTASRDETAEQLKKLEQVRKTGAAYRVADPALDPRFVDRAR